MATTTIRIFLVSPSADTAQSRAQLARVVREISADPKYAAAVDLVMCRWDDPVRPVALSAAHNPQIDVLEQVADPSQCDLVVGLFRHTMGGTLPPQRFGKSPQGGAWHCTEWALAQALQGKQVGTVRDV